MDRLALFLLGPPGIEYNGESVQIHTRKSVALLAYLVVTGESHTRDALATLFWPESDQARARASLRKTLSLLRKSLHGGWLEVGREELAIQQNSGLWVDVNRFRGLLAACRTHNHSKDEVCSSCVPLLAEAVDLYRDDFLTGFTLPDSPGFDEWQFFVGERLRGEVASALERLVQRYSVRGELELAVEHARRRLALDPLHEPAHRQLMQLYTRSNQRAAALRQYETCVQVLERELAVPPEDETTQLYQSIVASPSSPGPTRSLHSHNLPYQRTSLVGREEELTQIGWLLEGAQCRLLTLTGPGGIGKTHLAIQAAAERVGAFPDGVFFVPLAALSSTDALVPAIVDALKLSFPDSGDLRRQLLNHLRDKAMLLVLDNLEHLLEGTELLVEVLQCAAEVKILTTSRERLNVKGEWVIEVQGLRVPRDECVDGVEAYSAVQLFAQSARRVHYGFDLAQNESAVVRICKLVEGIPLAIEMATAWVRVLPCSEISDEIERNLAFLVSSQRDVPERHNSLMAAFDHSWRLLEEDERLAFARLSVFRGGFSREAAEFVAAAFPGVLAGLVDKSFVQRTPAGRYKILEPLRQYAEEKREKRPQEDQTTQDRHGEYYLGLLHRQERFLRTDPVETLRIIEADIENVRAACQWAVRELRVAEIDNSLESLYQFLLIRSRFQEGERTFGTAVEALCRADSPTDQTKAVVQRLLARRGVFCSNLSHYDQAEQYSQQSLTMAREQGNGEEIAFCLVALADAAFRLGRCSEIRHLFEQALAIAEATPARHLEAACLRGLGKCYRIEGRFTDSTAYHRRACDIYRQIGDRRGEVWALRELGNTAFNAGDASRAKTHYEPALGITREISDRYSEAQLLTNLGAVAIRQADFKAAMVYCERALCISREIGAWSVETPSLQNMGSAAECLGLYDEARACYESLLEIHQATGNPLGKGWALMNLGVMFIALGDTDAAISHLDEALHLAQAADDRGLTAHVLFSLGHAFRQRGDGKSAKEHTLRALDFADDSRVQGFALTNLGRVQVKLGKLEDARVSFHRAADLHRQASSHHLATVPLAGLAQTHLIEGDLTQARSYVDEILDHLETGSVDGTEDPFFIYLICYQVLQASGDSRATEVLSTAHDLLQTRAQGIADERLRRSFLQNVPSHREIVHAFESCSPEPDEL